MNIKDGKLKLAITMLVIMITIAASAQKPTIEWVDIPAGTFIMGSPKGEMEREKNETQHQVTLSAFKMSKYEITYEQYDRFCEATGRKKPDDSGWGRDSRPVMRVSWDDAKAFADWMGCRLPTEAEWEYACRAGTTTTYYTGNNLTTDQANYNGNYPYYKNPKGAYIERTVRVGNYEPNAWGLYDMYGNVWEWCSDWYRSDYYLQLASTGTVTRNPKGPDSPFDPAEPMEKKRVHRGGSFLCTDQYCTRYMVGTRGKGEVNTGTNHLGFRCVKDAK